MRPLDILSITLVLCAIALIVVLPVSDNEATLAGEAIAGDSTTLHYPGQQRRAAAPLQFEEARGQSRPMLFDPDQTGPGATATRTMPTTDTLFGPTTPAPSMGLRYPAGHQIYSF